MATPDDSSVDQESKHSASTALPEYYSEIKLAPSVEDPRRLVFIANTRGGKSPPECISLRADYERTARVVAILFDNDKDSRHELFMLMHQGCDRGLRGTHFSVEDGRANLVEIQENILDLAHKVRDRHLASYSKLAVVFGLIPLVIGAILILTDGFGLLTKHISGGTFDPLSAWIIATCWIPAGAAICVWAEFVLRMQAGLSYDQLLNLDPSRWRPGQRLQITIGIAFIFAFLLEFKAVQVGLGNMLLNDFSDKLPAMSLAVGGATGLSFAVIRDIIFRIRPTVK